MKTILLFKVAATLACATLLVAACTRNSSQPQATAGQNRVLTAPTGASVVAEPEDGQWTMPAKNYASTRFSGLEDINTSNVANLKLAWSFSTGVVRGHEAAPIVVNNTMYVITPYPNIVYAIDLNQPTGPLKWKYEPNPVSSAQGVACCDVVNRGVVYADNRIFFNTLDNHTIALDASTGTEIWKTKVGDINLGESMTMAPLVVKGKVLVGNSGESELRVAKKALVILIAIALTSCASKPSGPLAFVTNERDGTITVIDTKTDR